jgi:hypothetical protein
VHGLRGRRAGQREEGGKKGTGMRQVERPLDRARRLCHALERRRSRCPPGARVSTFPASEKPVMWASFADFSEQELRTRGQRDFAKVTVASTPWRSALDADFFFGGPAALVLSISGPTRSEGAAVAR